MCCTKVIPQVTRTLTSHEKSQKHSRFSKNMNDNANPSEVSSNTEPLQEDYDAHLSSTLKEELQKHEHCFDYQLTEEQIQFVNDNGYLVIKGLIEPELCDKIVEEIFDRFLIMC